MMAMNGLVSRWQGSRQLQSPVCQFCRFYSAGISHQGALSVRQDAPRPLNRKGTRTLWRAARASRQAPLGSTLCRRFATKSASTGALFSSSLSPVSLETALKQIAEASSELRSSSRVPPNESVVQLLDKCKAVAELLVSPKEQTAQPQPASSETGSAISPLLEMEEKADGRGGPAKQPSRTIAHLQLAGALSELVSELLRDEKVFISPEALARYSAIQTLLKRPDTFPEIFHLYANKPVPEADSWPVKYHRADPKSIKSAVPPELANMALDTAIGERNLALVLAIIDSTFCAPAFHRAKVFKKAAAPLGALAAAPAACYAAASWAASLQNTMDPSTATGIAFAAILAYVAGTSSVGLLAITTANDQMERVVWLPGIPLHQRWLREEERAALDKVAVTWGFKNPAMRGEEEGEEWESLREFIGLRGMILDKSDLMEGME